MYLELPMSKDWPFLDKAMTLKLSCSSVDSLDNHNLKNKHNTQPIVSYYGWPQKSPPPPGIVLENQVLT